MRPRVALMGPAVDRRAAILTEGVIPEQYPLAALGALIDPSENVSRIASEWLGHRTDALGALLRPAFYETTSIVLKAGIVRAVGWSSGSDTGLMAVVRDAIESNERELRLAAFDAVRSLGPKGRSLRDELIGLLRKKHERDRHVAAIALLSVEPQEDVALRILNDALRGGHVWRRAWVLEQLRTLPATGYGVCRLVLAALADESEVSGLSKLGRPERVCWVAVETSRSLGRSAMGCLEPVSDGLEGRAKVARALAWAIQSASLDGLEGQLTDALRDTDVYPRSVVLELLVTVAEVPASTASAVTPAVVSLAEGDDLWLPAAKALLRLGVAGAAVFGRLMRAAADEDRLGALLNVLVEERQRAHLVEAEVRALLDRRLSTKTRREVEQVLSEIVRKSKSNGR